MFKEGKIALFCAPEWVLAADDHNRACIWNDADGKAPRSKWRLDGDGALVNDETGLLLTACEADPKLNSELIISDRRSA